MKRKVIIVFLILAHYVSGQTVSINFSSEKIATAYPEVFGVVIKSNRSEIQSFDMLKEHGVKMIRATAPLNTILPSDITIEQYVNNVNDIQNPDNWPNWNVHSGGNGDFSWAVEEGRKRGFKTLLSIGYYPDGFSYGSGGPKPHHRVPNNWEIHKDLYRRTYNRFKDFVDMVGISNEPNFMSIDGSPYADESLAYKDMYRYASEAIREISPSVDIVGPEVAYKWKSSLGVKDFPENLKYVRDILNDTNIPASNINAITYHHYFEGVNVRIMESITDLPVYVTEWNASSGVGSNTPENFSGKESLSWIGNNLMELLRSGARGSCLFMHYQQPRTSSKFGTYEWDATNQVAIPHLNMKSFAILSKSLKLGDGESEVKDAMCTGITNAIGAVNASGEYVAAISNISVSEKTVTVSFNQLPFIGTAEVFIYEASETSDVFVPVSSSVVNIENGNISFTVDMPSHSLKGILLSPREVVTNLRLIMPAEGEIYNADSDITFKTNALQLGENFSKVEYYVNSQLLSSVDTPPFVYTWTNVGVGNYALMAKAVTNTNEDFFSDVVNIECRAITSDPVEIIGIWRDSLTHDICEGRDRLLVFTAHVEHNSTIALESVSYGGQALKKISDEGWGASWKSYVAAFYLDEKGIQNATDTTFSVVWSAEPRNNPAYSSVFFQNVNQITPIGEVATHGVTNESIETTPLNNERGDMAVLAATTGEPGSYSVDNGFLKGLELVVSSGDGITGYLPTAGQPVLPRVNHTIPFRQALVAFIVNSATSNLSEVHSIITNNFKVFPNPIITQLQIECEGIQNNYHTISIYNNIGVLMYSEQIHFLSSSLKMSVDFTNYPSGIYFVSLRSVNQYLSTILIKE